MAIWVGSLCVLTGCQPPSARQQAIANYSIDQSHYAKFVDEDPQSLNTDQLYSRALTLWGDNYTELRLPTSFGVAHVVVSGPADGYPLVLLHGMNTNSTMWYPNVPEFARNYQVYAIDYLLGRGKSKPGKTVDDVAQVMAWYNEIFNTLALEQFALVGASQGGWFATQIALNEPEKVGQLVLLSPAQTFGWIKPSLDVFKKVKRTTNLKRIQIL